MSSARVKSNTKKRLFFLLGRDFSRRENVASARKHVTCQSRIDSTRYDHAYCNVTDDSDAKTTPRLLRRDVMTPSNSSLYLHSD
jgi:hypothetical protein